MTHEGHIHVRRDRRPQGIVAHVTIDNQTKLNALNAALMRQFVDAMTELGADEELRAIVVGGAGPKAFIGGADIRQMAALETSEEARAFITLVHEFCRSVRAVPVPVIARLHGFCFGAGLELAASCDFRIAADTAILGMPEVKLGIPSVVEAAVLPTLIGWGRTRQLLMLGDTVTAQDAARWNLVEEIVPAAALDAAIETWLEKLLACPPRAIRLQKELMRRWEELPLSAAIQAGIDSFAAAFETDEPKVAMRQFLAHQQARKARS
jgi:enoyl-CoA hydratase/carnithine racemase